MKTIKIFFVALATLLVFQVDANSQWVVSSSVTILDTTVTGLTVTSTGNLTARSITITGDATIQSGGILTHSTRDTVGIYLNVSGTLDIQSGGMIDLNKKGLLGGNSGAFGRSGETFDASGVIVAGATAGPVWGAGASYGGQGSIGFEGVSSAPYGFLEDPRHLGSGGGGGGSSLAGNGGGRATIIASNFVLNGTLRANGGNGVFVGGVSGGGSGGAIKLTVDTLSGSGTIQANGGSGFTVSGIHSGAGGGGRVAIVYTTLTLPIANISASAIMSGTPASAGTVYLKDNIQTYGDLTIDNGSIVSGLYTPLRTALATFRSIALNRVRVHPVSTEFTLLTIQQSVTMSNSSELWIGNGVTVSITNSSGFDVNVQSGSLLLLDTTSTLNADAVRISGSTLTTNSNLSFPVGSDFELSGNGTLNIVNNATLSIGTFNASNIQLGTVNLPFGSILNIVANAATIGAGVILIKGGSFGASDQLGSLTIASAGKITHADRDTAGLRLSITGVLDVQSGGMLDVDWKGLRGGRNGSIYGSNGEAFNGQDSIVSGAAAGNWGAGAFGAGASYGGFGGDGASSGPPSAHTNVPYGVLENPRHLGSGGGAWTYSTALGGHGGGRIQVDAGSCTINGTVRANGQGNGLASVSAGGSGGSIHLTVGTLLGSGNIEANGGRAYDESGLGGGAGSGGRIAIYFTSSSFPVSNIVARGGSGLNSASAGTIFLKDITANADLVIDNGNVTSGLYTPLRSTLTVFRSLSLRNRARTRLASPEISSVSVEQAISLVNTSELHVGNGGTLTITNGSGFDVDVQGGSLLLLDTTSTLNADAARVNGGTLITNSNLSFPTSSDFELSAGGTFNIMNNATVSVAIFDPTNFQSGKVNMMVGSRLDIASSSGTIANGVTLSKSGRFGAADSITSLTINSGGALTHSDRDTAGLRLNITGILDVQSGGKIDVSGKGLRGGRNGSVYGGNGETFDAQDSIVSGAESGKWGGYAFGAGGSYGGFGADGSSSGPPGAATNAPYGVLENPRHLGSSGGAWGVGYNAIGGHGGGRITVAAGVCIINGSVRANGIGHGDVPGLTSAGGSGGGIHMNVGNLSGSGSIESKGGLAYDEPGNGLGGAGSGGRVAIYYSSSSFLPANIHAWGGSSQSSASAGTIYLKENASTGSLVIIDNGGISSPLNASLSTQLTRLWDVTVRNKGGIEIATDILIENDLNVFSGGRIGRK